MGLDVYLYAAEEAAQNKRHSDATEALFADGREPSDAEYRAVSEANPYVTHTEPPSERYPQHRLFNRRYLRSSYNGGGFNNAVPELTGQEHDLSWVFEPVRLDDQSEMELTAASIPALREARARALRVAEELRTCDRLRVSTVDQNAFMAPPKAHEDDALRWYRNAVASGQATADSWYSCREGEVFGGGLTVLAAMPGVGALGTPGVHLIWRAEGEGFDFYVEAAEITAEFCDEAAALIERDGSCLMVWSG